MGKKMTDNATVKSKKCIFVTNFRSSESKTRDLTLIKEKSIDSNGNVKRSIRCLEDVKRPFWVTKKGMQVHRDKRENEGIENLDRFECTQSALGYALAKATGVHTTFPRIRELCKSPYIYGSDVDVTVLMKRELDLSYEKNFGRYNPDLEMAVLDYETNMLSYDQEINMGSVTMKGHWYCAVDSSFLGNMPDKHDRVTEAIEMYLGKIAKERGAELHLKIVDSEIAVVESLFGALHHLKPDVCSIWNMNFDIGKTIDACDRAGYTPQDKARLFSDPSIPEEYQSFTYREDGGSKNKADGTSSAKSFEDMWHKVIAPSSFQFIDNMCLFRMLRAVEQKMGSYSLDSVLQEKTNITKMKFKEADHIKSNTPDWHMFMQRNHKLAYIAYNIFDCVAMEILDEEIKDVHKAFGPYCGISTFATAKSNPKRLADAYHFDLLSKGRVLCSTSNNMTDRFDSLVLPKTGWIITLDNTLPMTDRIGINPYDGEYNLTSRIASHVYDSDVKSSYPSNQLALNMSRDTTLVEVCGIDGLTLEEHRLICINLTNVPANAVSIAETVLRMPCIDELELAMLADLGEFQMAA